LRNPIKWLLPVVILGVSMVPALFAVAQTEEDPLGPGDHIPICHREGGEFVFIEPSATSGGPAGHEQHEADIFLGYFFQQNEQSEVVEVEGQNTDMADLLETNCEAVTPSPTPTDGPTDGPPDGNGEPPTVVTPPEDAADVTAALAETL
jgi:hypothetical protein